MCCGNAEKHKSFKARAESTTGARWQTATEPTPILGMNLLSFLCNRDVLETPRKLGDPTKVTDGSKTQIGGTIGGGTYELPGSRFFFGAEACLICDKRYAVCAGYQRWKTESQNGQFGGADTAFGGLRIQGTNIIRPFLMSELSRGTAIFDRVRRPPRSPQQPWAALPAPGITLLFSVFSKILASFSNAPQNPRVVYEC
jgi:hypothetical protein